MNPEHDHNDAQLALLLDCQVDGEDLARAHERMLRDMEFRQEAESLLGLADHLSDLGAAITARAGSVDLVDDIRDSIAHLAMEQLAVASASPFGAVERALADFRHDFDAQAESVSLVDDIMQAVAASHLSDEAVEQPYLRETSRLRLLGEALAAETPQVDLVMPVADELKRHAPTSVVPLRARPVSSGAVRVAPVRGRWSRPLVWAAAAAGLIAGAWVLYPYGFGVDTTGPQLAREHVVSGTESVPRNNPDTAPVVAVRPAPLPGGAPAEAPVESSDGGAAGSDDPPLTLQDVINARRADLVNDTRAIAALASMTKEEAIALLKDMDLSIEALIGATQFLSTEEAIAVLRAAILEHPDDPHLRYALATKLGADPDATDERLDHLAQMAANDTENGLPHYLMASDYLARGETGLALDALSRGSAYADSSAYALEAARQREAALVASGLEPDVARLLALSTSGETEYADIGTLRSELLDYGAYYEEMGEYETARQIYNAVNQLGQQLAVGADLAVERQYGLETQQEAILAIQGIAEALQDPQISAWLGDTLTTLASGIAEVAHYIQARQELVLNPALTNQLDWSAYLEHVIRNGDLNISNFLD